MPAIATVRPMPRLVRSDLERYAAQGRHSLAYLMGGSWSVTWAASADARAERIAEVIALGATRIAFRDPSAK